MAKGSTLREPARYPSAIVDAVLVGDAITFTDLVLYEFDANTLALKNLAKTLFKNMTLGNLTLTGEATALTFFSAATIVAASGLTMPAFTAGGAISAGAGSLAINTTGASLGLTITSTNDTSGGVAIRLNLTSATPADNDFLGSIIAQGKDDGATQHNFGEMDFQASDVTAATYTGYWQIYLANSTAWNKAMTLSGAGALWSDLSMDTLTYKVSGTQVVGAQGAAIADATDAASVILRLNDLLARCRAHGLIAT